MNMRSDKLVIIARSATEEDDYPIWMAWNGQLNVTNEIATDLGYNVGGAVFGSRLVIERLVAEYNAKTEQDKPRLNLPEYELLNEIPSFLRSEANQRNTLISEIVKMNPHLKPERCVLRTERINED